MDNGVLKAISGYAGGDARVALNTLEHLLLAKGLSHHEQPTSDVEICRISVKDIEEGTILLFLTGSTAKREGVGEKI